MNEKLKTMKNLKSAKILSKIILVQMIIWKKFIYILQKEKMKLIIMAISKNGSRKTKREYF